MELTHDEIYGIVEAVDHGLDDRQSYMQDGNPHVDYGDEWPESAREQARRWGNCASALRKIGAGEFETMAESCESLARSLEASASEFAEDNPVEPNPELPELDYPTDQPGRLCPHGCPDGVNCIICDTDGAAESQGIFPEGL